MNAIAMTTGQARRHAAFVATLAALAGLMFGLDVGVISGAQQFIQREFAAQAPKFREEMARWIAEGAVKYKEDIVDGLENAPEAFIGLLEGRNFGKLIVKL